MAGGRGREEPFDPVCIPTITGYRGAERTRGQLIKCSLRASDERDIDYHAKTMDKAKTRLKLHATQFM